MLRQSVRAQPFKAAALFVILAVALGLRLSFVLTHDNYLGVDGGAYLLGVNAVLGDEPTGAGFPRPPLAPGWQLVPFVQLLGIDIGYKVWAALAAMAPILGTYLLAGVFLGPRARLVVTGLIAFDPLHSEMMVTGALPLEGFGLIMVGLWAMIRLNQTNGYWLHALTIAAVVPLTVYVNQTSAGLIAIVLPIYSLSVLALYLHRTGGALGPRPEFISRKVWRLIDTCALFVTPMLRLEVWMLALGGLLALTALPWYLGVGPNSAILHYPGPWVYLADFSDNAWFLLFWGAPIGAALIWKGSVNKSRLHVQVGQHREEFSALGVVVLVLTTMGLFWSTDETVINLFYRAKYLVVPLLYIGGAVAVGWAWRSHATSFSAPQGSRWIPIATSGAFVFFGLWVYASYWSFHNQAGYSDMITVQSANALSQLPDDHAGIISNSFTMSLWVAALEKVPSPHVWTWEPPRAYTETDEDVRCILGWVDGCSVRSAFERLAVTHVLVEERFPKYNDRAPGNYGAPEDQWKATAAAPWLNLVFAQGTTRMYEISAF